MFERFTEKAIKVILFAHDETRRFGHNVVGTEQILLGLLGDNTSTSAKILRSAGLNLKEARVKVEDTIGRGSGTVVVEIPFSEHAKSVLERAAVEAESFGHNHIEPAHLLLGILSAGEETTAWKILVKLGLDEPFQLRVPVVKAISGEATPLVSASAPAKNPRSNATPTLDEYGIDLTATEPDNLLGREHELERVLRILRRSEAKNPLLIGEPGVGKSAIVKGLASLLSKPWAPEALLGTRIISIDIPYLMAFSEGQFLLKKCVSEAEASGAILVIEEVHRLFVAPLSYAMKLTQISGRFLARSNLSCIGIATLKDYLTISAKDRTVMKYFQPVLITPSTAEETLEIINSAARKLEAFHQVSVSEEAIQEAVRTSDQLKTNRSMPGKSLQILDEACALVRMQTDRAKSPLRALRKIQAVKQNNKEPEKETSLLEEEKSLSEAWAAHNASRSSSPAVVSAQHVSDVLRALQSAYSEIFMTGPDNTEPHDSC